MDNVTYSFNHTNYYLFNVNSSDTQVLDKKPEWILK